MFIPRTVKSQLFMSVGNYRGVEIEKLIEPNGCLRVPFSTKVSATERFDNPNGITFTIFALEKLKFADAEDDAGTPAHVQLHNACNVKEVTTKGQTSVTVKSRGVQMVPVELKHLDQACDNLNVYFDGSDGLDFEDKVVQFLLYIGSFDFSTTENINDFCKMHGLVFRGNPTKPKHKVFACFRVFMSSLCPISIGVVDGQHRMLSVVAATEMLIQNGLIPTQIPYKTPNDFVLRRDSEVFRSQEVRFVFYEETEEFFENVKAFSKLQNYGSRVHTKESTSQCFANALKEIGDRRERDLKDFKKYVYSRDVNRLNKDAFFDFIEGPIHEMNDQIFEFIISELPDDKSKDSLRQRKEENLLNKQAMRHLDSFDILRGLCHVKKVQNTPSAFSVYFDVIPFIMMGRELNAMFYQIYSCMFMYPQDDNLLVNGGEKEVLEFKPKAMITDFVYYGMIRPFGYLSELIADVIFYYVSGMKLAKMNELKIGFGFSEKRKKDGRTEDMNKDMYCQFPDRRVPPSLFMFKIEETVDVTHFKDINTPGSSSNHLRSTIMKPLPPPPPRTKTPKFLDKDEKIAKVSDYSKATVKDVFPKAWEKVFNHKKNNVGLNRKEKRNFLKTSVRIAILTDYADAVVKYGPNPQLGEELILEDDTLRKLGE